MLIPFFDFGNNHIEEPIYQAGKPYYKAKGKACQVSISPVKAEKGQLLTPQIILGKRLKHYKL